MNDDIDPEDGDRVTPPIIDSEALLAAFREAEQGVWTGEDDEE